MGFKRRMVALGHRSGLWRATGRLFGSGRLTVLAYHRVVDLGDPDFRGFRGVVSASPREFAEQIAWTVANFTPVTLDEVAAAVGGASLPERSVLVTFDDGYRDNMTAALPVLREHGIKPVIFLATDHIGLAHPFWWDLAAWAFETTALYEADLPVIGHRRWHQKDLRALERSWIEAAKALDETDKQAAVERLVEVLGVTPGGGEPDPETLSWAEVETMAAEGVDFGAHTASHPILTKVPAEVAHDEVRRSVRAVEETIGRPVLAFAYPNGRRRDFDEVSRRAVEGAGVPLAFSLLPGPARAGELRSDPLAIPRIYVHHGDGIDRFAAKVNGIPRLLPLAR